MLALIFVNVLSIGCLVVVTRFSIAEGYGLAPSDQALNGHRRQFLRQSLTAGTIIASPLLYPGSSKALSPEEAATDYDTYASNYDDLDGGKASTLLGIDQARASLFSKASGRVLEIGAGTGLNLSKYDPSKLKSLVLLDISQGMLDQANKRFRDDPTFGKGGAWEQVSLEFVQADATSQLVSKFGAASFDTVVDSFSLCVMGNEGASRCLNQLRQIVKPNQGKVLLLENSRSSNPLLGKYQDATATAAASAGGKGCVYNQDVRAMIEATKGLTVDHEEAFAAGLFRSFECSVQPL
jgi:methyltransferase OMS1